MRLLLLFLIQPVFCFFLKKTFLHKPLYDNINPLAYENIIAKQSFNDLLNRIDKKEVETIYFSNNMKKIYSRLDLNKDGEYDIEDYTITNSDSSVSNMVIERSA